MLEGNISQLTPPRGVTNMDKSQQPFHELQYGSPAASSLRNVPRNDPQSTPSI